MPGTSRTYDWILYLLAKLKTDRQVKSFFYFQIYIWIFYQLYRRSHSHKALKYILKLHFCYLDPSDKKDESCLRIYSVLLIKLIPRGLGSTKPLECNGEN